MNWIQLEPRNEYLERVDTRIVEESGGSQKEIVKSRNIVEKTISASLLEIECLIVAAIERYGIEISHVAELGMGGDGI